jgi:hypothetical protein
MLPSLLPHVIHSLYNGSQTTKSPKKKIISFRELLRERRGTNDCRGNPKNYVEMRE